MESAPKPQVQSRTDNGLLSTEPALKGRQQVIRLSFSDVLGPEFSHIEAEKMASFRAVDLRSP